MGWLRDALDNVPDLPGREALKRWGVPKGLRRMVLFWEVSACAWIIDVVGLVILMQLGVPVFAATCLAVLPALFWNFVLSTYKIYFRGKGFSRTRFAYYVAFNMEMVAMYGFVVSAGVKAGFTALMMKVMLAPVTFFVNFFFMRVLLREKKVA